MEKSYYSTGNDILVLGQTELVLLSVSVKSYVKNKLSYLVRCPLGFEISSEEADFPPEAAEVVVDQVLVVDDEGGVALLVLLVDHVELVRGELVAQFDLEEIMTGVSRGRTHDSVSA